MKKWKTVTFILLGLLVALLATTGTLLVGQSIWIKRLLQENATLREQGGASTARKVLSPDDHLALETAFYDGASRGNLPLVSMLLDLDHEFIHSIHGTAQATALHAAAYTGRTQVVKELLRRRANVNAQNAMGFTPLHDAVTKGSKEIVELLLSQKPDLTLRNNANETALEHALSTKHDTLAALLREHGARE